MSSALEFDRVSKSIGELPILVDVSFTVDSGEIVALVGANGSGKSTALNLTSRLLDADEGDIRLFGHSLLAHPPFDLASLGIARVFQTSTLQNDYSVSANVSIGRFFALTRAQKLGLVPLTAPDDGDDVVDCLGLRPVWSERVEILPYAWRRYVEIARAAAGKPKLLLIDEPTAGLTPKEREPVRAALRLLKAQNTAIVLVDHDMALITEIADRCVFLDAGSVVAIGPTMSVLQSAAVRHSYIGVNSPEAPC